MLTTKEIGYFIGNPSSVAPSNLAELKEMADKYPYAQLFSILYLKGMSTSNSVDFESALKDHSYRISDRAQLYALIHDHGAQEATSHKESSEIAEIPVSAVPSVNQVEINSEEIGIEAISEEEVNTIDVILSETIAESNETVVTPATEEVPEESATPTEVIKEAEPLQTSTNSDPVVMEESPVAEIAKELGEEETTEAPIEIPSDPLEESILHHVLANNYQLPALSEEEEAELLARQQKEISEEKEVLPVEEIEEETDASFEVETRQTFTGWLHANTNYETPKSTEKEAITAVVKDFSDFDPMESLFGTVEKPKKEFYSPAKKAKESLNENQLPVSETLAKIYLMQGNYPKAIEAYKELSLAFPEKKIFFANQIEDLQKKLNK